MNVDSANEIAKRFIVFLETEGSAGRSLRGTMFFATSPFTLPKWRLQAQDRESVVALRQQGNPAKGKVPRWRCDPTRSGFVLEVEERRSKTGKTGPAGNCFGRMSRGSAITELSVYCTQTGCS